MNLFILTVVCGSAVAGEPSGVMCPIPRWYDSNHPMVFKTEEACRELAERFEQESPNSHASCVKREKCDRAHQDQMPLLEGKCEP